MRISGLGFIGLAVTVAGCSLPAPRLDLAVHDWWPGWHSDYTAAEAQASETGRPLIIYFKGASLWGPDPSEDALRASPVADRSSRYVRCILHRSNEADRRYMRQFKIDRAPALVLIHADGTFHAVSGELDSPKIAGFLEQAHPPGEAPSRDPFLPQPIKYAWYSSLGEAKSQAENSGRPLLVVLDRPYARDWERLAPMLHRREVHSRFAGMVACRPNALWKPMIEDGGSFGVRDLPAIVIVWPGGANAVLELPNNYESIVRFADRAKDPSAPVATSIPEAPGN